jgi:two-component system chemotaxis response regulator CheY
MSARILIVDDSGFARRVLRQILENAGYAVDEAIDGYEALERYRLSQPSLVLLDMIMAPMTGLDLLPLVLEIDPEAKVIIASADVQKQTAASTGKAGAAGWINKPFEKSQVLATVSSVLQTVRPCK